MLDAATEPEILAQQTLTLTEISPHGIQMGVPVLGSYNHLLPEVLEHEEQGDCFCDKHNNCHGYSEPREVTLEGPVRELDRDVEIELDEAKVEHVESQSKIKDIKYPFDNVKPTISPVLLDELPL